MKTIFTLLLLLAFFGPEIEGATTRLDCSEMTKMYADAYFYTMTQLDDCPRVDLEMKDQDGKIHKAFTYANGYGEVDGILSFYNHVTLDGSKNALWELAQKKLFISQIALGNQHWWKNCCGSKPVHDGWGAKMPA